ncbi:MAG TPA: TonB-dependent receptor [Bryobacteraceae bacterium]|nr:TonB-dependent receptor [Bryobacteraceae bacterium]
MKFVLAFALCAGSLVGQRGTGEIRLSVTDSAGASMAASGNLVNQSTQLRQAFTTDPDGRYTAQNLPFGIYRLQVEKPEFTPSIKLVEVRSELPQPVKVAMDVAGLNTEILVTESDTLIDPFRTGTSYYIGSGTVQERKSALPGRSVAELVDSQPGFLLEANGVLHPRGSEYNVQYVVDGIPVTDNRSPAFAPEFDADDVQQMKIMTSGYAPEYGRKLGGVVELSTQRDTRPGFHGRAVASGGTFATATGYLLGQYGWRRNTLGFTAESERTDRFLDPPVEDNFTNKGKTSGAGARFERDISDSDRLKLQVRHMRTGFLVPNERMQQSAGQRQDRRNMETMGQFSYQRILPSNLLANVGGMLRDLSADLWSNALSTPISVMQQRGFREVYLNGSIAGHRGRHEFKAGAEGIFSSFNEHFGYDIVAYRVNGRRIFDRDTPATFRFADRRNGREQSLFVQDLVRAGPITFSGGIRWDHYSLLLNEQAWSPRMAVAWSIPRASLVLHASYDRAFETPAIENLLLSSSEAARSLNENSLFLPVRPSRGNFYEAGFTKGVLSKLRWTANYFRRDFRNFADDSLLLNTGVSFPVEFQSAHIQGFENKLEVPRWGPFSGYLSYSNLIGKAQLPIAGGLFLGDEAEQLLKSNDSFAITQDQRNTVRMRVRSQLRSRAWIAVSGSYGSGLPVEVEGLNRSTLAQEFGARVLDRVNLERGRVRPSFSLDSSLGIELWKRESRSVQLQADAVNVTDRLNVINFAGLFSGTALSAPRSYYLRIQAAW